MMIARFLISTLLLALGVCLAGCGGAAREQKPELLTQGDRLAAEGSQWYQKGCYNRARAYFAQSLSSARLVDDLPAMLRARNNLGAVALASGRLNEAGLHLQRAMFLNRVVRDQAQAAHIAGNLADLAYQQGELEKAGQLWKQAVDLARPEPGRAGLSLHLANLGAFERRQGRLRQAEAVLQEALGVAEKQGEPQAGIHLQLGLLRQAQGLLGEAEKRLDTALDMDRQTANPGGIAADLTALGGLELERRRYAQAELYLDRALRLRLELGDRKQAAKVLGMLSTSHLQGRSPPSLEPYRRLLENASSQTESQLCR
jgi:tetratricopeptide (TPR) repeat protein